MVSVDVKHHVYLLITILTDGFCCCSFVFFTIVKKRSYYLHGVLYVHEGVKIRFLLGGEWGGGGVKKPDTTQTTEMTASRSTLFCGRLLRRKTM